jgi:hypothetical protein
LPQNGHFDVYQLLVRDGRSCDIPSEYQYVFTLACQEGNLAIVEDILQLGRIDPGNDNNAALCASVAEGRTQVVKRMLQEPQVKVTRYVLMSADNNGCDELVELLVTRAMTDRKRLFGEPLLGESDGLVYAALRRRQMASMRRWVMCTRRTQGVRVAARVADVMRDIHFEWAIFDFESP